MDILKRIKLMLIFPIFMAVLLAGCGGGGGGGGGSTFISGTAAAGAPVVGFVSIRDSSTNAQPVKTGIPIAADGKYSIDVSGLKAPFAFLADGTVGGKRVQLYSAATQADVGGTINITPFTDLMIRNIAGTIATTLVDAITSKLSNLSAAQLDAERVKLTAQLAPVLLAAGLGNSIDLLRASFNADHTGLDRFMDLVKVDTTLPTAVTIINILNPTNMLTVNPATGITTGGTTLSAVGVTVIAIPTPVDLVIKSFDTFSKLFANGLPSSTDPALTALFSSTFLQGGTTSANFLTELTTDRSLIGLKFARVVVNSVDVANGTAEVNFTPLSATGVILADDNANGVLSWKMKRINDNWLFDGDQRIAHVRVRPEVNKNACNPANTACTTATTYQTQTGLRLKIDNQGMRAIGSAVVTGPGLPGGGVTLSAQANRTWFSLPVSANCTNCTDDFFAMTDDLMIALIPGNSVYTVKLYSNAVPPVLLATYTDTVPVAPVLNSALPTLSFPTIGGMINLASYAGGTLTPSWTIPTGLMGNNISVSVWQLGTATNASGPNQYIEDNLKRQTATTGSSVLVLTAPASGVWSGGNYWISASDQYGRRVSANYR